MAKRKKLNIALIFGGTSRERAVSLVSASSMAKYLDSDKYDVILVEIDERGKWLLESRAIKQISQGLASGGKIKPHELVPFEKGDRGLIDAALLALHGPGGEDGTIQGMLELLGVPYTCSGVLASALAMDKAKTKKFLAAEGMPVVPHLLLGKKDKKDFDGLLAGFTEKMVVKPNRMGSSLGVAIVKGKAKLKRAVKEAFRHDDEIIIEPFVKGREITVPVLGNSGPKALPAVEILPLKKSIFYDYAAKYEEGGSEHVIPAALTKRQESAVKELAVGAHEALGCRGVTRSDFILGENGKFYFLEINTIPGMTPTSLVPQAAAAAGIGYARLLDTLIKLARQ